MLSKLSFKKLNFVRAFCDRGGSATAVDGHTARYTKCSGGGDKIRQHYFGFGAGGNLSHNKT